MNRPGTKCCRNCEWTLPDDCRVSFAPGLTPKNLDDTWGKVIQALGRYIVSYLTKMRCCDCALEGCDGDRRNVRASDWWGYCANYKRKWWKFWRPK